MRHSNTIPALPVYDPEELEIYGNACYDAGRAEHIAEAEQMVPLTYSQLLEIMDESGWPPSILAAVVIAKLVDFARAIEAAVAQRKASTHLELAEIEGSLTILQALDYYAQLPGGFVQVNKEHLQVAAATIRELDSKGLWK